MGPRGPRTSWAVTATYCLYRLTAGQLPGNWFELANDCCCYAVAVTADTVPIFVRATDHKCI